MGCTSSQEKLSSMNGRSRPVVESCSQRNRPRPVFNRREISRCEGALWARKSGGSGNRACEEASMDEGPNEWTISWHELPNYRVMIYMRHLHFTLMRSGTVPCPGITTGYASGIFGMSWWDQRSRTFEGRARPRSVWKKLFRSTCPRCTKALIDFWAIQLTRRTRSRTHCSPRTSTWISSGDNHKCPRG